MQSLCHAELAGESQFLVMGWTILVAPPVIRRNLTTPPETL